MPSSERFSRISIGRALTALNFQQQRYEADFRFNLVRVRENSEQIALLRGEQRRTRRSARSLRQRGRQLDGHHVAAEKAHLSDSRLRTGLLGFSHFMVVSPAYFAGAIQLGGLDANVVRLWQRARRPFVLRQRLPISLPNGAP